MSFEGVNTIAVIAAAVAAFVFGAVFYGTLSKPWMKAARLKPEDAKMDPVLFATTFVCELVMAWVMAGMIGHFGAGQVTLWNGVVSAFFVWLGFMATTMIINQRYQMYGWDLSLIDGAHWLGVALIMGAVIGAFGL